MMCEDENSPMSCHDLFRSRRELKKDAAQPVAELGPDPPFLAIVHRFIKELPISSAMDKPPI
jgi:hypothetical protein